MSSVNSFKKVGITFKQICEVLRRWSGGFFWHSPIVSLKNDFCQACHFHELHSFVHFLSFQLLICLTDQDC